MADCAPQTAMPHELWQTVRSPRLPLNTIIESGEEEEEKSIECGLVAATGVDDDQWLINHFLGDNPFPLGRTRMYSPTSSEASPADQHEDASDRHSLTVTTCTDFDDISVISRDDDRGKEPMSSQIDHKSTFHLARQLQPLIIPPSTDPFHKQMLSTLSAGSDRKLWASPIVISAASPIALSPLLLEMIERQRKRELPAVSAEPSLDGSLSSDQLAAMSTPPTPTLKPIESDEQVPYWAGVQLDPDALATLRTLPDNDNDLCGLSHHNLIALPPRPMLRISSPTPLPILAPSSRAIQPSKSETGQETSASMCRVSQTAPGRTGLTEQTMSAVPTSTSVVEHFYRRAWGEHRLLLTSTASVPSCGDPRETVSFRSTATSDPPVEHLVEVLVLKDSGGHDDDDQPTAKQPLTAVPIRSSSCEEDDEQDLVETLEIIADRDSAQCLSEQKVMSQNKMTRMESWLTAQRSYMPTLDDTDQLSTSEHDTATAPEVPAKDLKYRLLPQLPHQSSSPAANAVLDTSIGGQERKVEISPELPVVSSGPCRLPSRFYRPESAFYRAFIDHTVRHRSADTFIHRAPRFEALQAQRSLLRGAHLSQLLGKYQLSVVPQSSQQRLSAIVTKGEDGLVDDMNKLRHEKEQVAMAQMAMSVWHVEAVKFLNGGRLISAPIAHRLAQRPRTSWGPEGVTQYRRRILDLGGQVTGDWAWHVAHQFSSAKVYTVTTKSIRQMANANISGPPNHRNVAVEKLSHMPFPDHHFDLISARELHSILRFVGENGEDEWETCLQECMRVLKPGGYLDFSLLDSDVINAGPVGLATSVELGFALKTLGFDPTPTKAWLGRLARAGFENVRRAWVCLPLGERRPDFPRAATWPVRRPNPAPASHTHRLEAMVLGSTDSIASVCSVAACWSWERWLLRCEAEKAAGQRRLVDVASATAPGLDASKFLRDVAAVIEEGRICGSAWRMLTGYARKPKDPSTTELISIGLAA